MGQADILKALDDLNTRERKLGGYIALVSDFYPRGEKASKKVLVYMATPENELYRGPRNMVTMATEISMANGHAGSNVEYVTRLADYVRENIPEDNDEHLFTLDKCVRYLTERRQWANRIAKERVIALPYNNMVGPVIAN